MTSVSSDPESARFCMCVSAAAAHLQVQHHKRVLRQAKPRRAHALLTQMIIAMRSPPVSVLPSLHSPY